MAQTVLFKFPATYSYFVLALLLLPVAAFTLRLRAPVAATPEKHAGPAEANTRLVFLIAAFLFLYVGAEVGFAGWIFTYTIKLKLSSATTAAYLVSLFWGSLTLGRMLTIPVAAHFKLQTILISSLTGSLLSLLVMLVRPDSFAATLVGTTGLAFRWLQFFPPHFRLPAIK